MNIKKFFIINLLLCFILTSGNAQIDSLSEKVLNNIDTLRFAKVSFGAFKIAPYIAPTYSPETSWMLAGGGLMSFKVHKDDAKLNYSSIPFSFGYSTSGAINLVINNEIFWVNDKFRIIGEFQYKDMPDNYWGVGYSKGISVEKSDSTTAYVRKYFKIRERFMFNLGNSLFLGPVIDVNFTKANEMNDYMAQDEYVKDQGVKFLPMGFGVAFEYDSRDFPSNAYHGWYLGGSAVYYNDWIESDAQYLKTEIIYRQYKTIRRKRRVLAWQVKSIYTEGAFVPWTDLSMIGGKDDLRGYTLGRFRDQKLLTAVIEYRHMFKRKRLNKKGNYNSRFGYVTWVGTGSVGEKTGEMTSWLPNAGLGFRFEVRERMNIRVDAGFGKQEHGFYITFKEAF